MNAQGAFVVTLISLSHLKVLRRFLCDGQGAVRQALLYMYLSCFSLMQIFLFYNVFNSLNLQYLYLTLLHSEWPKLYRILALPSAIELRRIECVIDSSCVDIANLSVLSKI